VMPFFSPEYTEAGPTWSDPSTGHVAYFGQATNIQVYYPDIASGHLDNAVSTSQGLTFMPVQKAPQAAWMSKGVRDESYYDPTPLGGTGGGGIRWTDDTFYASYSGQIPNPWTGPPVTDTFPSLADQFNQAMQRHMTETPTSVNAWGFNHHIVNVMSADLSGLSDNWGKAIVFMGDIADGVADGVINEPRPDLVQFVTMQELSEIYDSVGPSPAR
jgi:hypothetical protein